MDFYWQFILGILIGCVLLMILALVLGTVGGFIYALWEIHRGS